MTSVLFVLKRLKQEDHQGKASRGYTVRSCLKKKRLHSCGLCLQGSYTVGTLGFSIVCR